MGLLIDLTVALTRFDHGNADAIFDAVERLKEFAFGKDGRASFGNQAINLDHRGVANGLSGVGVSSTS